ncbi:MAG: cbb3-type cytochrome c oxidase subunit I, partial [Bacteroidota bacterium]|nr:cbb3-type cytochrome c oxidase subunit I [Bacteroidota bacterium]
MSTLAVHDHGVVHHEDGHEHHHKATFLNTYVFSQDHKYIAKQFLVTGIIMAFIAMTLSILFRIQLAYPDKAFPLLETLLGRFAPGGRLSADFYMSLVTIHGTIMVFFVLTAGLSGTFANLLIPLQVGARDMASPFVNMLSYWFFLTACIIMLSSFFVQKGPASGGWTIYPPLSALPKAMSGSAEGMTLWLISMVSFVASSLMGGINYVSTV